jgi:hypothetical protein
MERERGVARTLPPKPRQSSGANAPELIGSQPAAISSVEGEDAKRPNPRAGSFSLRNLHVREPEELTHDSRGLAERREGMGMRSFDSR